jgi:hypothetical protein
MARLKPTQRDNVYYNFKLFGTNEIAKLKEMKHLVPKS